ncbi:hypothetical protein BJY04DRAFT_143190 [Aspergillus karnatakaensis]|uniref:SDR family oxidoreductase n=1 Tax=Aspergillus karnatakaensis TaxID=1810916 RepID=UPI003CCD6409
MSRVWHITGANTGLGLEIALKALAEGDRVIAAVRSPSKVPESLEREEVRVLQFDLTWLQPEINEYVEKAFAAFGKIDVFVNTAGYSYMAAIEESEDSAVKAQFDANVFAYLRLIRAALPNLRTQGTGTIINFSSIGGLLSAPTNGIYCATKFALEAITQALNAEIAPFGLNAFVVQPGYFRTSFLTSVVSGTNLAPPLDVYKGTPAHEAREALSHYNGNQPGNPKEGAARVWEYVADEGLLKGKQKLDRLPLGKDTGGTYKVLVGELEKTAAEYQEVWESTDFKQ